MLGGARIEVHRWHPPLAYGRADTPGTDPADEVGAVLLRVGEAGDAWAVVTYSLPTVSARAAPALQAFAAAYFQ